MGFPEQGIEPERVRRGVPRLPECNLRGQQAALAQFRIRHGHTGVRERELRVFHGRLPVVLDRPLHPFGRELDEPVAPLEVELVRLEIGGRALPDPRLFVARELGLERRRDVQGYVGLDPEDVGQLPVVGLAPEVLLRLGLDELRHDAHPIPGAPDAAIEHRRDLESRPDLPHALCPLLERHH